MKYLIFFLFFPFSLWCYDVLTYGDAIFDYFVSMSNEELEALPGKTGGSEQVDLSTFEKLTQNYQYKCPGGSHINTLKGLALLGHDCACIGRIGNDNEGKIYMENLYSYGITPLFTPHNAATGRVVCMISPQGNRTMRSYIGSLAAFKSFPVDYSSFQGIKLFHIEGYQIPNFSQIKKLIASAKKQGALISMDLATHELAGKYKTQWFDLIENDLDIVFCNADEARVLTGLSPKKASEFLANSCKIAVVTTGEKGGYVATKDDSFHYSAIASTLNDDTGAGDLFMAGFLHGIIKEKPLKVCANMGAIVASKIVRIRGAELPKDEPLILE